MKIKAAFAVLAALLVAALIFLNRTPQPQAPAPSAYRALPVLPKHFFGHASASVDESVETNMFRRLLMGKEIPKLTPEQIAAYLAANHRNAESLLAGLHTTGDRAFLREAMEKFPHDPKVAYTALFFGDLSPEETRQWADTFKQAAPGNAMADYASALNYMKSGQSDLALQDMTAAASLKWSDYSSQFVQSSEEAYRAAGYSDVDAKAAAQTQLWLPDLAPLKQLGIDLAALADSYQQAGNSASAQATLQMAMRLGQQLSTSETQPITTTLVGYAIQSIALNSMDPNAPYGNAGQTVQDQINQLHQLRESIQNLGSQSQPLQSLMSEEDLLNYYQRRQNLGPLNALQWAVNKYGQP